MKTTIKDYIIKEKIGSGGMGTVYRAEHPGLKTDVILKQLDSAEHEITERFKREATILMGLRHENIVPVFDYFIEKDNPYIVMEYVDGKPLSAVIEEKGKLDPRVAILIFSEVARGLEYAHNKGVVHRDLKPHNIIISKKGEVKIIDFGIASIEEDEDSEITKQMLTKTGSAIGTPAYMSPEQMRDMKSVTPHSDIYSMGVMLYEMLVGIRPFTAAFTTEAVSERMNENYKELALQDTALPAALNTIIKKCLKADPGKRYSGIAIPAKKLESYFRKLSPADMREIIADYIFRKDTAPAIAKMKPLYSSFIGSFRESKVRRISLYAVPAVLFVSFITSLFLFTDLSTVLFRRGSVGALEIEFNLPLRAPLRRFSWYREHRNLPDREKYPGLYRDRSEAVAKALKAYIDEEYSDILFNFQLVSWLMKRNALGQKIIGKEKIILRPKNYIRMEGGSYRIVLNEDGSLPETLVLSSGPLYRPAAPYSASLLLNGASYRSHFTLKPLSQQDTPAIASMRFITTPRNKIHFNFQFLDAATGKRISDVKVRIGWGGNFFDWEKFSREKQRMDYLWNGRSFWFRFSHPDYDVPDIMKIRVDRDQTIANVVLNVTSKQKGTQGK
ncbi:MAG TPA: serine/threonine-protein kinase [Spirochaetota bacterium]|nr:serine/threonine-protein kinase [Spirochaetota bacterium]